MAQNPFSDPKYGADLGGPQSSAKNPFSDPDYGKSQGRSATDYARDVAATAVKGAIGVPEALVGLADLATGGAAGKFLENEGGAVGFRPKQAREIVNDWHSDATKEAQRKFEQADGIVDKAVTAIQNPSLIATAVGESLPSMGAGGVAARGLMAATRLGQMGAQGAVLAGAAGEGITAAGSQAEQIRQETPDGLLTPGQAGAAVGTGLATGAFGVAGGKVAQRLGIGDAETMLAQGQGGLARQFADNAAAAVSNPMVQQQAMKSIPRKIIEGAVSEGFLEELPQSVAEQVFQNLALDKPWYDDVDSAIVLGTLSGGAMGAAAGGFHGIKQSRSTPVDAGAQGQPLGEATQGGGAQGQPEPPSPALERVREAFVAQLQDLQAQEQGEDPGPQSAPPDGAAALAAQRAQAQAQRQAEMEASRSVESPDDEIYQSTGAAEPPRSVQMGLNPAAGPLSAGAALAVDSGAADQMQQALAAAQAVEAEAKGKKATADAGAPRSQEPARSSPDTAEVDLATGELAPQGMAAWSDTQLSAAFRSAQSRPVRIQLAQELARRRADRGEPSPTTAARAAATAPAVPEAAAPTLGEQQAQQIARESAEARRQRQLGASERWMRMTAEERQAAVGQAQGLNVVARRNAHTRAWADLNEKHRAALMDVLAPRISPSTTTEGSTNGPEASQAQQAAAQPAQAGAAPAPAPVAAAEGLNDGSPTSSNAGAQAAPAAGAQAAQEGRAQRAERIDRAGEAWTRMPAAERQAVAGRLEGVRPVIQKSLKGAQWENLNADLKRKIADAMEPARMPAAGAVVPAAAPLSGTGAELASARTAIDQQPKDTGAAGKDSSHLVELEAGLARERDRLRGAATDAERTAREVKVAQAEREVAGEREFLGFPPEQQLPEMSDDELAADLAAGPGDQVPVNNAEAAQARPATDAVASVAPAVKEDAPVQIPEGKPGPARAQSLEEAKAAVSDFFDWYLKQNPNAENPMPGMKGDNAFVMDEGGAPFTKAGQVMVNGQKDLKFTYKSIWDDARRRAQASPETVPDRMKKVKAASASPAPAKPKSVPAKLKEAQAARADYFTPGNIVKSYSGHDRVIAYTPTTNDSGWSVTVQAVRKEGDSWVDLPGEQERVHWTQPDAKLLKAGPVARPAAIDSDVAAEPQLGLLERHNAVERGISAGTLDLEQYKQTFAALVQDEAATKAEISKLTKDDLLRSGGASFAYRYKGEKKDVIVNVGFNAMLETYALGRKYGSSSFIMSSGGLRAYQQAQEKALRELVANTTQEDLAARAAEIKAAREEVKARREAVASALENPRTLQDYRGFMRQWMEKGDTSEAAFLRLTPEQRQQYDALEAESSREAREKAKADARVANVRSAGDTTAGEIIATKHTKHGHDLFVIQLSDRVAREDYETLNASARRLGGNYSSFRGNGAIPGFQFRARESAEAFQKLVAGDASAAREVAQARRDAFEDDKSQTAVERLRAMADAIDAGADEQLYRERKVNTVRRAQMAGAAEEAARNGKAFASTMRNLAAAIEAGKAPFLDGVRTKTQLTQLQQAIGAAKAKQLLSKYGSWAAAEQHKHEPADAQTVDFVEFPRFSMFRSDLAGLARQLLEIEGGKKLGAALAKVTDDVTDAYTEWAKSNLQQVSQFGRAGQMADFASKAVAERAIKHSGLVGKAVVLAVKRGQNRVVLSPGEAMQRGLWQGDGDKRINLSMDFVQDLVKLGKRRGSKAITIPWQLESTLEKRHRLQRMGIQTPAEYRSALRELVGLREAAPAPDRVKELERSMVGRQNDGLDFFPTGSATVESAVDAADIQPGMEVLEPSAGWGHIADHIREQIGVEPDVVELSGKRRELLEAKGYNLVGSDFMEFAGKQYDRIVMNPPFSDGRDIQHVQHAFSLLKPGGRLVAIMSESAFFQSNKRAESFREWLDSMGATNEKLPEGAFMDPSLPVNTSAVARMVVVDNPAASGPQGEPVFRRGQDDAMEAGRVLYTTSAESPPVRGLSLEEAQQAVQQALTGGRRPPPIDIVARSEEAWVDAPEGVMGAAIPEENRIVLVSSAHGSADAVVETLFHEMFHLGLHKLLPTSDYVQSMLDLAKRDSRVQQYAVKWKSEAPDAPHQLRVMRERGYTGSDLTGRYEALAIEEGLAVVAEELRAQKQAGTRLGLRVRTLASWLASVADRMGMERLSAAIRKMTYNEAERFVMTAIDNAGQAPAARDLGDAPRFRVGEEADPAAFDVARFLNVMAEGAQAAASPQAQRQAVESTRAAVAGIVGAWKNGPEVVVAYDMADPVIPQAARNADLQQRSGGASGAPEGFYWDGKAYLLASALPSAHDAARVLYHEALGHYGLRGAFGKELDQILNQVATMRRADIAAKAADYGLDLGTEQGRRVAAEEVLAGMAEKTPGLHFVQRAVSAIRNFLRARVPGFQRLALTDNDIIQAYILPARGWVERRSAAQLGTAEPQFARHPGFSAAVDAAVKAGARGEAGERAYIEIGTLPQALAVAGVPAGSLKTSAKVLQKVVFDHGVTPSVLKRVPELLEKPVMVFRSATVEGRFVAVTSEMVRGAPLIVAISPETTRGTVALNFVPSLYPRDDLQAIQRWLNATKPGEQLLTYLDKEQSPAWFGSTRLQLPGEYRTTQGLQARSVKTQADLVNVPASGADPLFSRAKFDAIKAGALAQIEQSLSHPGTVSLWDKTVGTMRHLAERAPAFKPVFDSAQRFIDDVSMLGNDAADAAPRLLPRVESWGDLRKKPITAADNKAIARPLFEGTLSWGRDVDGMPMLADALAGKYQNMPAADKAQLMLRAGQLDAGVLKMWLGLPQGQFEANVNTRFDSKVLKPGVVWSDKELRDLFGLEDGQISLYREARAAIDRSIDMTARADMLRGLGAEYAALRDVVMAQETMDDALEIVTRTLMDDARAIPDKADRLMALNNLVVSRFEKARQLMEEGYAPLSRFGRYTVDVVDAAGERQYFGMFETKADSNRMAEAMTKEFPRATITQGTMSTQAFKLFAGITPESLELFGNMLGLESEGNDARDKAFQDYLRLAKNNHSSLKRLIHRKGIAGYSEDVGRVLASFVYSNARQAAGGLNAGVMETAINDIPKEQGELKDVAMGLQAYIRDPQEEGQAVRGMLFAQYLGGSLASAFVNMTQPFSVTLPWLTQFGGMRSAASQMARALNDMRRSITDKGFSYEADLAAALQSAQDDGVVSPQEIHQLMAQARGAGALRTGDGTRAGDARAAAANHWERLKVAWGQPFALAEQFNRRSTFIAAYRLAKEQQIAEPSNFARRAVLETQFLYSKANKMRWARGAVGGTLLTFKTYSVSYLELMHRMWTQGGPEGKRAVGWAVAMLLLMGGAGGLPFMEDAEDLIDGSGQLMGYNLSTKQWRKQLLQDVVGKELAEFMEQGMSGLPGAPIDVSGRLGMGNLLPGTGLLLTKPNRERDLLEIAGPAGDLVARGFTGARKVLTGDLGGAALEVSPTAVRNAAKGIDMAASGMYKDAKGYKVLDTTLPEAAAKFIGFQPKSVAEVQEANAFMLRTKSFYSQTSAEIKAQWADALFRKDEAALERVRGRLAAWNRDNPEQPIAVKMPDVWKRVREMGKDRTERIADTAPKALRQQMRGIAGELG